MARVIRPDDPDVQPVPGNAGDAQAKKDAGKSPTSPTEPSDPSLGGTPPQTGGADPSQMPVVPVGGPELPPPPPPPSNTPLGIAGTFANVGSNAAQRFSNNRLLNQGPARGQRFGAGVPLAGASTFAPPLDLGGGGSGGGGGIDEQTLLQLLQAAAARQGQQG